jgi:FtsP/CotA-like multicopper oxidase with cupredoxin domain
VPELGRSALQPDAGFRISLFEILTLPVSPEKIPWAYHCHNLYHLAAGMFTTVVYDGFS